jgi:hypothetical protein
LSWGITVREAGGRPDPAADPGPGLRRVCKQEILQEATSTDSEQRRDASRRSKQMLRDQGTPAVSQLWLAEPGMAKERDVQISDVNGLDGIGFGSTST